jgi:hypothetical protein
MALPIITHQSFTGEIQLKYNPDQYQMVNGFCEEVFEEFLLEVLGADVVQYLTDTDQANWLPIYTALMNGFAFTIEKKSLKFRGLLQCGVWLCYFRLIASADSRHTPTGNVANVNENSTPATGPAYRKAATVYNKMAAQIENLTLFAGKLLTFDWEPSDVIQIQSTDPQSQYVYVGTMLQIGQSSYKVAGYNGDSIELEDFDAFGYTGERTASFRVEFMTLDNYTEPICY